MRETDKFSVVLQGQVKQYPQLGTFKTLALIPAGAYPNPIVVAGDAEGFITLLTINSNGQPETVSFGAHNDLKEIKAHVLKVFVFSTPGSAPILCSLDNVGRLRLWTE